jgi:hypothetical protein
MAAPSVNSKPIRHPGTVDDLMLVRTKSAKSGCPTDGPATLIQQIARCSASTCTNGAISARARRNTPAIAFWQQLIADSIAADEFAPDQDAWQMFRCFEEGRRVVIDATRRVILLPWRRHKY